MEIVGKLHAKFETQDVSASFRKRDFVLHIEDNPQYPQFVQFQLTQEKCAFLDLMNVGTFINVAFNLRGRQWVSPQGETKYFNTLEVWRVLPASPPQSVNITAPSNAAPINATTQVLGETPIIPTVNETDSDDLPF